MHCCNNKGAWGAGFVKAISKRWKEPEQVYRKSKNELGTMQIVKVEDNIMVANLIGQNGYGRDPNTQYLAEGALYKAMATLAQTMFQTRTFKEGNFERIVVHAPRLGAGLAGGKWPRIEAIINKCFPEVDVYIYDLPR